MGGWVGGWPGGWVWLVECLLGCLVVWVGRLVGWLVVPLKAPTLHLNDTFQFSREFVVSQTLLFGLPLFGEKRAISGVLLF